MRKKLGLMPLARVHTATVIGDDPVTMSAGPIAVTVGILHLITHFQAFSDHRNRPAREIRQKESEVMLARCCRCSPP